MKRFLTYIIITLYLTSMSITADAADQVPQGTESYHVYTEITVTASQLSVPTAATMPSQLPSGWSIKSSSSGHNGNAAAAVATATKKNVFSSTDHSMTVTLTCDPDGTIH